jgi:hypothetical protein
MDIAGIDRGVCAQNMRIKNADFGGLISVLLTTGSGAKASDRCRIDSSHAAADIRAAAA